MSNFSVVPNLPEINLPYLPNPPEKLNHYKKYQKQSLTRLKCQSDFLENQTKEVRQNSLEKCHFKETLEILDFPKLLSQKIWCSSCNRRDGET